MSTELYAEYAGLRSAGGVADRQATHLADVGRYVEGVCGRTEAFRGFLAPFAGVYDAAVAAARDGVAGGGRAAGRWADATRDTATGLEAADDAVRRVVAALGDLLPGGPWHLPGTPLAPVDGVPGVGPATSLAGADPSLGAGVPVGAAPDAVDGSPVPLRDLTGLRPDLPSALGPLDPGGPLGSAGGVAAAAVDAGRSLWEAGVDIGDAREEAATTGDDLDRFERFLAGGRS